MKRNLMFLNQLQGPINYLKKAVEKGELVVDSTEVQLHEYNEKEKAITITINYTERRMNNE